MKKLLGVLILTLGLFGFIDSASASETSQVEYNILQGGTQEFTVINEDGKEDTITITEESSLSKALGNGTYTISNKRAGSYEISYQIVLNKEKITTAKNAKAVAITGSFISKTLKINSSTQATYSLIRKYSTITDYINLKAKISNSKIIVTT